MTNEELIAKAKAYADSDLTDHTGISSAKVQSLRRYTRDLVASLSTALKRNEELQGELESSRELFAALAKSAPFSCQPNQQCARGDRLEKERDAALSKLRVAVEALETLEKYGVECSVHVIAEEALAKIGEGKA